ncbi:hypothetical protein JXQ70_03230, partial [bacterium]|nr:hypothetical protein [bacterium]
HARAMPWPQDRHDPAHTNNYNYQWPDPSQPVPDLALPGLLVLIVLLTLGFRGRSKETGGRRQEAGDRRVKSRSQESKKKIGEKGQPAPSPVEGE